MTSSAASRPLLSLTTRTGNRLRIIALSQIEASTLVYHLSVSKMSMASRISIFSPGTTEPLAVLDGCACAPLLISPRLVSQDRYRPPLQRLQTDQRPSYPSITFALQRSLSPKPRLRIVGRLHHGARADLNGHSEKSLERGTGARVHFAATTTLAKEPHETSSSKRSNRRLAPYDRRSLLPEHRSRA